MDPQDAIVRVKGTHGPRIPPMGPYRCGDGGVHVCARCGRHRIGPILAATTILEGMDHLVLLAILAGTYVAWGAGLRVNLGANWLLLEATGTSSSAPSKAAYELAKLRTRSIRARRFAAAIGYVGTEAAKELPTTRGPTARSSSPTPSVS